MLPGPLFRVEMVSLARRRRYFFLRVVYAALALLILWAAYSELPSTSGQSISIQQGARLASGFFLAFSWLQILTLLVVGPALAVGTIATERERRTIEYLFTTDLSNAEIVLGKLAARLCLLGQLLLVGLPILFLFRLLGGIPAQLLLVMYLLSASTALLIVATSVCLSVWSERARDATVRVYLWLVVLLVVPLVLKGVFSMRSKPLSGWLGETVLQPVVDFAVSINPLWILASTFGSTSALGAQLQLPLVWQGVGRQTLVAAVAVGLATFAVRRVHLRETTKAATKAASKQWQLPRWRRPLGQAPMVWKELFAGTAVSRLGVVGRVCVAILLATILGFTLYALRGAWISMRGGEFHEYLMVLTGLVGTGLLLLLASRSAGLITAEKESDCWLSLLATPLEPSEIVQGKLWGNLYAVRWPLGVLAVHWGLGVWLDPGFALAAVGLLAVFLLYASYVTLLGLFFSLHSDTSLRAMGATLGTLLLSGGGYLFCCCVVGASGGGPPLMIWMTSCIPFQLAYPLLPYLDQLWPGGRHVEEGMTAAFVWGTFLYVAVSLGLYAYLVTQFNRLAGRTGELPRTAQPTAQPTA